MPVQAGLSQNVATGMCRFENSISPVFDSKNDCLCGKPQGQFKFIQAPPPAFVLFVREVILMPALCPMAGII